MLVLHYLSALALHALAILGAFSKVSMNSNPSSLGSDGGEHSIITDLTITFGSCIEPPPTSALDSQIWHCVEKELYSHAAQRSAWLHVAQMKVEDLTPDDLVVVGVKIGELSESGSSKKQYESRPGGMWLLRDRYIVAGRQAVTGVDILFGTDAVDPRPAWDLMRLPLQLNASSEVPVARLSVRHGNVKSEPDDHRITLRARDNGKFKIAQISDTHMVTGVGICKDAADADGRPLPDSEADPLTVAFLSDVLDIERPDLVLLTGDQVHHDVPDTQSALFKVVAPLVERSIPYAAVFGNHDAEGTYALSRASQMSILQDLPYSLCLPGPEHVDGVGNYYLGVLAPGQSRTSVMTLFLLDSHGEIASKVKTPDYDPIKQSQIDWFTSTSKALRKSRQQSGNHSDFHVSLAFMHIPLPEFGDQDLNIKGGHRREPTEGPSVNSHFYDALIQEGVVAVGCGHDHVNEFCGRLPQYLESNGSKTDRLGPWLCYGGGSGFGGYCSYDGNRYHRRTRIWELDTRLETLKTWKRVEYANETVDELVLVGKDAVNHQEGDAPNPIIDQAVLT